MKYFRTIVEVEVLSEDTSWDGEIYELADDITNGECSGRMVIKANDEVTPKRMAKLLVKQGSDPGFFGLDEDGNEVDE